MFDILYHNDLDINSVEKTFPKTLKQLKAGDFKSADVRKMAGTGGLYRARLDIRDRLLFHFVTYKEQKYILLLEIIKDHNYARSRFLRGTAEIDEDQLIPVETPAEEITATATELPYIHPEVKSIHTLNKFISFDRFQQSVYMLHPPLIIVGSAGSGKTALVLEKLKTLTGNVLYVSLSKYLVDNASGLYYSFGYDNDRQEADFLSLHDYLALWQKPTGKEINFTAFERWYSRHQQTIKINEPYRIFEEFKGVITGSPVHAPWLTEEEYINLGVKQSIFAIPDRKRLYPLFLKYLEWMKTENYYDGNILCYEYIGKIKPCYDYVMIDEVQDMTNIQLKCILASLKNPANFILTGDSNQIVHPNFFSWSKIKSFFYEEGSDNPIEILRTNYRNSLKVAELSNNLLKIKNARFGSIDKESNYLVDTVNQEEGEVILYAGNDKMKQELNRRTQNSAKYAVIVPSSAHKPQAARLFKTPLIFSVHEAKGLEYENVILTDFISSNEAEFKEIISGVNAEDLLQDQLRYNRGSSKYDKDAEIYKFYINSFYVAITRAIKNIYIFEQLADHPALLLLQMKESQSGIQVKEASSSTEEWLDEARRLEEQGKYEQAEQIRAKYLGYEYLSPEQLEIVTQRALDPALKESEVKRERKQLFQHAINHRNYEAIDALARLQFQRAIIYMKEVRADRREYEKNIRLGNKTKALATIQKYGIDFTNDDNATGLMLALQYGQSEIAEILLLQGANTTIIDKTNRKAFDYLFYGFLKNKTSRQKQTQLADERTLSTYWTTLCPKNLSFDCDNRQFRISAHSILFVIISIMRHTAEFNTEKIKTKENKTYPLYSVDKIVSYVNMIPDEILPPNRKKRSNINSVLAMHEIEKDSPYNKCAFMRIQRGTYILNPLISF
jgi:hypothetical protein